MAGLTDGEIQRIVNAVAAKRCGEHSKVEFRLDEGEAQRDNLFGLQRETTEGVAELTTQIATVGQQINGHVKAHGQWVKVGIPVGVGIGIATIGGVLRLLGYL